MPPLMENSLGQPMLTSIPATSFSLSSQKPGAHATLHRSGANVEHITPLLVPVHPGYPIPSIMPPTWPCPERDRHSDSLTDTPTLYWQRRCTVRHATCICRVTVATHNFCATWRARCGSQVPICSTTRERSSAQVRSVTVPSAGSTKSTVPSASDQHSSHTSWSVVMQTEVTGQTNTAATPDGQ